MKRIIFLSIMMLLGLSVEAAPVKLSGKITLPKGSTIDLSLVYQDADGKRATPEVSLVKNRYEVVVECEKAIFGTMYGVITDANGSRRQTMNPVYVKPTDGKIRLDITFHEKGAPTIKTKNADIMALSGYNALLYTHHATGNMSRDEIKPFLDKYMTTADSVLAGGKCSQEVKDYIGVWSYIQKANAISQLRRMCRDNETDAFLRDLRKEMPGTRATFDNEMSLHFSVVPSIVISSLPREKTTEEKIAYLRSKYTCKPLVSKVEEALLDQYVSGYDYNKDANAGYEALCRMVEGRSDAETYLDKFRMRTKAAVGATAPDVPFLDKEGREHRFSDFKGKYIYVDFWASWCVPCVKEIPHLKRLEAELQNDNVVFLAISVDEDKEAWIKKMEQLGMEGHQYIVRDRSLSEMLNIKGIPFYVIFDKEGKLLIYNAPRPSTGESLKTQLESLK